MEDSGANAGRDGFAAGLRGFGDDEAHEVSLLELANVLLKRRRLVVGLPLVAAVLMAIISLLLPAKYTATTTFVPESESEGLVLPGGLAGLASQFGVALPTGGANSPRFYSGVLESRTVRDQVLLAIFPDPRSETPNDSAALIEILGIEGENRTRQLERGRRRLAEMMSIFVDNGINMVSLSVETRYPALSAQVANLAIDLLNRFNLETRQSNARERRRFIEERVSEAQAELQEAEDALQVFMKRNRSFAGSPELTFEHERLQRQVTIKQEVYTTLRRSYEEARIQEVNDTPVITVIDYAVPPDRRSSPKRKLNTIVAFFAAAVVGVFGALGLEFAERVRAGDDRDVREFSSQWAAVKSELRSLVRRWRRRNAD